MLLQIASERRGSVQGGVMCNCYGEGGKGGGTAVLLERESLTPSEGRARRACVGLWRWREAQQQPQGHWSWGGLAGSFGAVAACS